VKCAQMSVVVDHHEHPEARDLVGDVVAGLAELRAEPGELSGAPEDRMAFAFEPLRVRVGGRGKGGSSIEAGEIRHEVDRRTRPVTASTVRRVQISDVMAAHGHEQVVFIAEPTVGIRAVIAVHSTALGPSLGGIRFWNYVDEGAAIADALRLSEAMSLKAAAAGLDQGGGKAVVQWDDPSRPRTPDQLRVLGRAIHELGGRYIAAEDVGATTADMDGIAAVTPWVTGVSESLGGSGDPSPVTARGVLAGMRAAARERWNTDSLAGRHVVIQGAGKVGSALARLLVVDGARVSVGDVDPRRVRELVDALGIVGLEADGVVGAECDVFAPCALGDVVSESTVESLHCEIVCGGANNQLASDAMDDALAARGILYAPDFVVNAGGILNIAEEFVGYSHVRALAATARIEATTARVFELGRKWKTAPGQAAVRMGRERIEREPFGSGRWEPGDPAAWTNGEPLTRLRPS
jgi:Glutamate dehydrogenase/leucine dehydrogenase